MHDVTAFMEGAEQGAVRCCREGFEIDKKRRRVEGFKVVNHRWREKKGRSKVSASCGYLEETSGNAATEG